MAPEPLRPGEPSDRQQRIGETPVSTGSVLAGRYRLSERIGRGGMADVYRGDDQVLRRPVAVKVFRFDTAAGEDRRRIDAEVRTLASLRHPGLVTVFDAGTAEEPGGDATPFLVMELITGPTLSRRLAAGPLTTEQTAELGADLATTLSYVHDTAIVHRDVKPANILLDTTTVGGAEFSAKLTDFGIARLLDSTRLTMHGMTIGTANYLSPEQALGQPAGTAGDIYSLALVLIECLTGKLAYPGVGIEAAVARLHHPPPIPAQYGPDWTQLLTAMTEHAPHARPSADEVAARLTQLSPRSPRPGATATTVLGDGDRRPPPTALLPAPPPPHALPRMSRRVRLAGTALMAAVAIAVLVSSLSGNPEQRNPPPAPTYPSVGGQLGRDLDQMEGTLP